MQSSGVIYQYEGHRWEVVNVPEENLAIVRPVASRPHVLRKLGLALLVLSFGGIAGPLSQAVRLEGSYYAKQLAASVKQAIIPQKPLPPAVPKLFNPLIAPDGSPIAPVNTDFSLIIPKIGVNAAVLPAVDPGDPARYLAALEKGVAHASTSFFPDQDGTVYLFSHSTNYDWFVKDLNAVFYLIKNLASGDLIVLYYKGRQYSYRLTEKRVVSPSEISYLTGQAGKRGLILQTCWPPGSVAQRLLIFADLIEEQGQSI